MEPIESQIETPTAEDPFGSTSESAKVREMAKHGEGPSYEARQGAANQGLGGSTDPNNSLGHADSGDESMTEEKNMKEDQIDNKAPTAPEGVDGFSDVKGDAKVGIADPGNESDLKPLDPEEYAKAQKEARTEEDK